MSATRSFTESYLDLQLSYLELLHNVHISAIKKPSNRAVNIKTLDQNISSLSYRRIDEKMSYKKQDVKLEVTCKIECNSESGELIFDDLVNVILLIPNIFLLRY